MVSDRPYRVVVLGGYGNFGVRICQALVRERRLAVVVAGRNGARAADTARRLTQSGCPARLEASALDARQVDLARALRRLDADLLIHTCGPFQGQDYQVARACIDAKLHYVDLADARRFVSGFAALDADARAAGVLVVSGASSVPALSGAVRTHCASLPCAWLRFTVVLPRKVTGSDWACFHVIKSGSRAGIAAMSACRAARSAGGQSA